MTGTDDVKIIEGVIKSYLDGLYESDADKIASVFHQTSALTSGPVTSGWTKLGQDRRRSSRACPATIKCLQSTSSVRQWPT